MTRKCAYLLWLAALMIDWGATRASAQSAGSGGTLSGAPASEEGMGMTVTMVNAGGVEFSDQKRLGNTPIGLEACKVGDIEVSLSGLPNSPAFPYLEVWYGTGEGKCNQADRNTRVNPSQNCTKLVSGRDGQQINSLAIFNTTVKIPQVCALNSEQTGGTRQGPQTLWFLLLRTQGSNEAAQFYRAFTINIDTDPPKAPEGLGDVSGYTDIKLRWELPEGMTTNYWLLADYSEGTLMSHTDEDDKDAGGPGPDCPSNFLKAGDSFDPKSKLDKLLIRETGSITREYSFDGRDFEGAKKVPVAVAAQDLAGNIGPLSKVVCISVVPTRGFWEDYKQLGGAAEPGCACSAPGTRTNNRGAVLAAPVALVLVGAYARRRIRRRAR